MLIALIVVVALALVSGELGLSDEIIDTILNPSTLPTPLVVEGEWWQVYFTEPVNSTDPSLFVNGIDQYLMRAIDGATRTIDIAAYEFNLPSVTDAVVRAARDRGVRVRVVTDNDHGLDAETSTLGQLVSAGIPVVDDARSGFMHNKFVIIDGRQVWTGSWNFTVNGTFRNNNNVIAITAPDVAAIYTRKFEQMFSARQFGPTAPALGDPNTRRVMINDTLIQVLFAPADGVGGRIAELVNSATHSVRFMAFSFTHNTIGEAVLNRARAGVDVAGIFETRGSLTEFSNLSAMFCEEVAVRQDTNPRAFHHKVFIIDDETVILGSFNFSLSADRTNDENVLVIHDAEIAAAYLDEFNRRWAESAVPEGLTCSL